MALKLTPDILCGAYDFLCLTLPFKNWNLPDGEDVKFKVVWTPGLRGWYKYDAGKHSIGVSASCIGHTVSLIEVMAHEMIHLHESHARICRADVEHSAAFKKMAKRVCDVHGFDYKLF